MQLPFHPLVVHFPLALSLLMPIFILVFAYMIKLKKMSPIAWAVVIGLQIVTTATGYVALETGEDEEEVVEKIVSKKWIHEHEEKAEIFVGSTVVLVVLSAAVFFLKSELQFAVRLVILFLSLVSAYLGLRTGHSGGELVYRYGAGAAYAETELTLQEGLLPTPGLNTSESPLPIDENESLKEDESVYGDSDEADDNGDEEFKQED
jgi:uncharacterized membrane protein